ncbi:MAG: class I SAM-dependent rRNA methyltransferase [Spirochaetae bacterium HGW-Spirochaetae-10]|nr:MAG: class I SAM-dependent rRNA methyltransferase [Spirochaetae bacterium HGW-Spirochaetae-10]
MAALVLKKDRERSVLHRHPWIFSGGVHRVDDVPAGSIVTVQSHDGAVLGAGFYDPAHQIRCRLFHFGPLPASGLDDAYWTARLEKALLLRRALLPEKTTGFRLIHSESDGFPGLICDIYDRAAVLQIQHEGARSLLQIVASFLKARLSIHTLRVDDAWHVDGGEPVKLVEFVERGLRFKADLEGGQKTGFFLDQRENRRVVEERVAGRTVLNAFAYTGGFSAAAFRGGAKSVLSVDLSDPALLLCEENVRLNAADAKHETLKADCFDYLREIEGGRFDAIILDPPAFAKTRSAVDRAARGYKDINLQAMKKIAPSGLLFTFSCSQHISTDLFRKILFAAATDAGRDVKIVDFLTQAPDHPISIYHPEGEYLKGCTLFVE